MVLVAPAFVLGYESFATGEPRAEWLPALSLGVLGIATLYARLIVERVGAGTTIGPFEGLEFVSAVGFGAISIAGLWYVSTGYEGPFVVSHLLLGALGLGLFLVGRVLPSESDASTQ